MPHAEPPKTASRFTGLRHFLTAWIAAILLLLAIYGSWYAYVSYELAAEKAAAKARGEPVEMADITFPPVPASNNAATLYYKSIDALTLSNADIQKLDDNSTPPEELARIVRSQATALAFCKTAAALDQAYWGLSMDQDEKFSILTHVRQIISLLRRDVRVGAIVEPSQSRTFARLQRIEQLLALARAMESRGTSRWVRYGGGVNMMAAQEIEWSLPQLDLHDPAARALAKGLIPRLICAERELVRNATNAVLREHACALTIVPLLYAKEHPILSQIGPLESSAQLWLFRQTRHMREWMAIDNWKDMPPSKLVWSEDSDSLAASYTADLHLQFYFLPIFSHLASRRFRLVAETRMAAVALAIRLYATDHSDSLPARLNDLIPDYIAEIPVDPFSASHDRLRYVPDLHYPRLYSVGEDGIDDGGRIVDASGGLISGESTNHLKDQIFILTGSYPPPLPPNPWSIYDF